MSLFWSLPTAAINRFLSLPTIAVLPKLSLVISPNFEVSNGRQFPPSASHLKTFPIPPWLPTNRFLSLAKTLAPNPEIAPPAD